MKTLLTLICCSFFILAFSQPTPPVVYKEITAPYFSKGDRIWMGEAVTVTGSKTFTVAFSDSMEVYRRFVQANPNLAFQLNFYWRHEGVKYPGRSEAVKDTLMDYFTTLTEEGMNPCQQMIYSFKHKVNKQTAILQLELEVVGAQTINGFGRPRQGALGLPDMNILYREYDNKVEFATNTFADSLWIESNDCAIKMSKSGLAVIRATTTESEARIRLASLFNGDTMIVGEQTFLVYNPPLPAIYLSNVDMRYFEYIDESAVASTVFMSAA